MLWIILLALCFVVPWIVTTVGADFIKRLMQIVAEHHPDFQVVDRTQFPHVDTAFYRASAETLESMEYVHVADVADLRANQSYFVVPTFAAVFLSGNRRVFAEAIDVRAQMLGIRFGRAQVLEFSTAFTDGVVLETSNALNSDVLDQPETVLKRLLPEDTPCVVLEATHRKAVADYEDQHPGIAAVKMTGLDDYLDHAKRAAEAQSAFRLGRREPVTRSELKRIAISGQERVHPGTLESSEEVADKMRLERDDQGPHQSRTDGPRGRWRIRPKR